MARRPARELLASLDRDALAQFQAGIRKRYTDEEIIEQLLACARRLGRSPSMREFSADSETSVHPQTVIEHFGSWNAAKRAAAWGYRNVLWYRDGTDGWEEEALPTEELHPAPGAP